MKILIAEDDLISRKLLSMTLEQFGYEVEVHSDGAEAWASFDADPVRVVVSDWLMPGLMAWSSAVVSGSVRKRSTPISFYSLRMHRVRINMFRRWRPELMIFWRSQWTGSRSGCVCVLQSGFYATRRRFAIWRVCCRSALTVKRCVMITIIGSRWRRTLHGTRVPTSSHSVCPSCYEHKVKPQLEDLK